MSPPYGRKMYFMRLVGKHTVAETQVPVGKGAKLTWGVKRSRDMLTVSFKQTNGQKQVQNSRQADLQTT